MRKVDNNLVFSPSDLITFMDSVYDSWMERCALEYPGEYAPDESDDSVAILQDHGNQHEAAFLSLLVEHGADVCEISGKGEAAELATIAAMQSGREVIYQGVLAAGQFGGRSDFLVKVPGNSKLGDFHYEVWDTKLSKKAKPYFVIQLCCYAEMLETIQGRCPDKVKIVLGDCSEKEFSTRDYIHFYMQLKKSFLEFQQLFSKDAPPDDVTVGAYSRWKTVSDEILEQRDDLIRVANIRKAQIQRLKKSGITTLTELSQSAPSNAPSINATIFQTLADQSALQIRTVAEEEVAYRVLPTTEGKGLALLPPASDNDIFFDMEGYPLVEGGLEYLFGAVVRENGSTEFRDWWAHDRAEEKKAFEDFVDFVYSRWQIDKSLHVYHYAPYEVSALRRLAGRHATRVDEIDSLLRNEIFVDLYQIVRQAFLVGVPSYSIKYIEHLYRPKREGAVAKATESVVFYERWLQDKDGSSWTDSQILKDIRDYNEADCVSTEQLAQWLWKRQSENNIAYTGKVSSEPPQIEKTIQAALAENLLSEAESIEDLEVRRVQETLAYLLEFHKREDKPMYWRRFDRQKRTVEDLYDDLDCLAGLSRTKRAPYAVKSRIAYEYSYDPDQDTKLTEDAKCMLLHDQSSVTIYTLDRVRGLVSIIPSGKTESLPAEVSLMPNEFVSTATITDAITEIALGWSGGMALPKALADLLFRREPDISGKALGTPVVLSSEAADVTDAICRMNETTLCIQGPPGCGKTYQATQAIVKLLKSGKRVGIASNSHKVIEHLTNEVLAQAQRDDVILHGYKVGGTRPDFLEGEDESPPPRSRRKQPRKRERQSVEHVKSVRDILRDDSASSVNLVAGTAWCFANEVVEGMFDYLVIDEAGQVCLANVVGMSRSARNLILLGDQMQLEQPIEGFHPGESGLSALEYYLQEHATIPSERGIFLDTTRRMHPAVSKLISNAVYEGRIEAHKQTENQVLVFKDSSIAQRLKKEAGIVWLPVEHVGNTQASNEEVDAIEALISDLLQCHYTDKDKVVKPITLNDILIVAPYNMQVRRIASRIPGAQVASVDKFQGREAPVVILSMCASEAASSPRGMEFLFSRSRLNVAISRAQSVAYVLGNPGLVHTPCSSLNQMHLLNFFCQIVELGKSSSTGSDAGNASCDFPIAHARGR